MKGRAIGWLPEELAWIEARKEWPRADLHRAFVWYFGREEVTLKALNALCKRQGWLTGRTGCFAKGTVPPNKGKKGMPVHPNAAQTLFKKGQSPANQKPIGYEAVDRYGYVKICVAEPNPWTGSRTFMAFKHRWLWEQANGPVPAGHALKCLDGNKLNTDPSNWVALPRGILPRLNGKSGRAFDKSPAELRPTILAIAKLEHAAHEIRKGKET